MKIVIDVSAHEPALAALKRRTDCRIECVEPPEERARELDPVKIADADALFCTFPPTNHAAMRKLKWIQIASTGYTQLHGISECGCTR